MEFTKARVITTFKCGRNCKNCCNKESLQDVEKLDSLDSILGCEEIMITGGEPLLIPQKVIYLLSSISRNPIFTGSLYLYSALYNPRLFEYYQVILGLVDGFQFTLHYEAGDKEVMELKELSECGVLPKGKSLRLSIDSRLYDNYDFSNIDFSAWGSVRKMQWKENCPLPLGEKVFTYLL